MVWIGICEWDVTFLLQLVALATGLSGLVTSRYAPPDSMRPGPAWGRKEERRVCVMGGAARAGLLRRGSVELVGVKVRCFT